MVSLIRKVSFLLVILLLNQVKSEIIVSSNFDKKIISTDIEIFRDSSQSLNLEQIISLGDQITFEKSESYKIPEESSTHWLKLSIENKSQELGNYILGTSLFDELIFYVKDKNQLYSEQYGGNQYPNHKKEIQNGVYSYASITVPAKATTTVYIKAIYNSEPAFQFVPLDFTLYSENNFNETINFNLIFNMVFLGAVLIMALYNLFLFFIVLDKSYLFYLGYNISILGYVFALGGLICANFFETAVFQESTVLFTGIASLFFYTFFSRDVLNLKSNFPKLDKLLLGITIALLIAAVLTYFGILSISIPICFTAAIIAYPVILTLATMLAIKKNSSGIYFLAANSFYIIGHGITMTIFLEFAPDEILGLSSVNFTQIGVIVELALFSLALGARINNIKLELAKKEIAHQKLLIEKEEEERKRISQDLHDGVVQHLTASSLYTAMLGKHLEKNGDPASLKAFNKTKYLIDNTINELRHVCHDLIPPAIEELGFSNIVEQLVNDLNEANPEIEVSFSKDFTPENMERTSSLSLFRAIQQILTNSINHGKPQKIKVILSKLDKNLSICVEDNGIGFNLSDVKEKKNKGVTKGIGLDSIKNRAQALGGYSVIESTVGKGTKMNLIVPLERLI